MTETQIAKKNVEDYEKQKYQLNLNKQMLNKFICITHKATCERWLEFVEKTHKILNTYHSQIPLVEIGRQNVLNDIDNEIKLDEKIRDLKKAIRIYEKNE